MFAKGLFYIRISSNLNGFVTCRVSSYVQWGGGGCLYLRDRRDEVEIQYVNSSDTY